MSARTQLTPTHLNRVRASLSPSEWAVLSDVEAMRLASARDLQALNELRESITVRHFRRRLQRLHGLGVLTRLDHRDVGGARAGSASWVYRTGPAGQRLLGVDEKRAWTPRPAWLAHALAAGHVYVQLRLSEAEGRLKLIDFQPEPQAWRRFGSPATVLKPDGFLRFETADELVSTFLEIDGGGESPRTIAGKAKVYERYWRSGDEQQTHGVFPEVLWLAPDERRRQVLRKVFEAQGEAAQLHRVRIYEQARSALIEPP